MFKFFKRDKEPEKKLPGYEIELTASILAYEVARSDGEISKDELTVLLKEVEKIAKKVNKSTNEILVIIENFSQNSVSFHEFISDINRTYNKDDKLKLISFLYEIAFSDLTLEVNEEKLIRRIANLIHVKDVKVLKIKDRIKASNS